MIGILAQYAAMIGVAEADPLLAIIAPATESLVIDFLRYDPEQKTRTEYYPVNAKDVPIGYEGRWESSNGRAIMSPTGSLPRAALVLPLTSIPIRAVTNVYEWAGSRFGDGPNPFPAESELTLGVDYSIDWKGSGISKTGFLRREAGVWSQEPGSIKVVYTAGYSSAELAGTDPTTNAASIRQACYLSALKSYKTIKANQAGISGWTAGPLFMERMGDYTYMTEATAARNMTGMTVSLSQEAQELLQSYRHYGMNAG